MKIDVINTCTMDLNQIIRKAVKSGDKNIKLTNVNGQRYIGDGIIADESVKIEIHGTPGNDLAAFMSGPCIEVFGNAQDTVANTLDKGRIIIHGHAGDLLGYGMRDGKIFIQGSVGYRVGVHMKSFQEKVPVIVIGGSAGSFFGEYMAGGVLILLGLHRKASDQIVGDYLATGMHGGAIYVRGEVPQASLGKEVSIKRELDAGDEKILQTNLKEFAQYFDEDYEKIRKEKFIKLYPANKRPYAAIYYGFKPVKTLG